MGNGTRALGELLLTNDAFMVASNWATIGTSGGTGIVTIAGNSTLTFKGRYKFGCDSGRAEINVRDNGYFYDSGSGGSIGAYGGGVGGTGVLNITGGRYKSNGGTVMNNCGANQSPYAEINLTGGVLEMAGGGLDLGTPTGTNSYARAVVNISGTGLLQLE